MAVKVEVMRSCVIPYFFMQTVYGFFHFFQRTGPFFLPQRVICVFMIWGFFYQCDCTTFSKVIALKISENPLRIHRDFVVVNWAAFPAIGIVDDNWHSVQYIQWQ